MNSGANRWYRNQGSESKIAEEELLVFGYSCKIFRDDEKATFIDQGKHLIPWMGDESLMIDRYDVRGYLHDLSSYESKSTFEYADEQSEEERHCDEERYLALRTDLTEEELYHEEELKRLRAAVADDGAYHEIGFSYDSMDTSDEQTQQSTVKEEEPEDDPYAPPAGLNVPKGMHIPSSMKIHAIIEKTSLFISQQGGQMEIIIKMKQSDNPQFAFMHLDNLLYPYYKHLVQEIKSGRYKPVIEKKVVPEAEDELPDDHYLHPSLSGAVENVPKFTVPSINFRRTGDDSYSLLVKNLKQTIEYDAQQNSPNTAAETSTADSPSDAENSKSPNNFETNGSELVKEENSHNLYPSDSDDSSLSDSEDSDSDTVIPPPPDVQPIIDKMAEYVAKNGEDFEIIVKSKNDKRFDFLKPGNKFYNYYMFRRNAVTQKLSAVAAAEESDCIPSAIQQNVQPNSDINGCETKEKEETAPMLQEDQNVSSADDESTSSNADAESNLESTNQDICDPDKAIIVKPSVEEIPKVKSPVKVIKGPISFSLKAKDSDSPYLEKAKKTLLLDDSEGEEDVNIESKNSCAEKKSKFSGVSKPVVSDIEEKPKKLSNEEMEAKLAEEKIKDRLAAAARERLAQQKRDKLLQHERKQRAALFLKMLKNKSSELPAEFTEQGVADNKTSLTLDSPEIFGINVLSPVICEKSPSKNSADVPLTVPSPVPLEHKGGLGSEAAWSSSSSGSETSVNEKEPSTNDLVQQSVSTSEELEKKKKKHKKRSHSSERGRSHKSRSKSHKHSKGKKHKRSRSRSSHRRKKSKSCKEKKLPAAYAFDRRSRSRSRSPPTYSSHHRSRSPINFNRWR